MLYHLYLVSLSAAYLGKLLVTLYANQGLCNSLSVCAIIRSPHSTAVGLLLRARRTGVID